MARRQYSVPQVIEKMESKFTRHTKILADGGYQETLGDWVSEKFRWTVDIVLRQMNVQTNFLYLLGWKILDGSLLIMNIRLRLLKQWSNRSSFRSHHA